MSFTLAELKQALRDYAVYEGQTEFESNLDRFIKNAERSIWGYLQLPFFKQNSTSLATPASEYMALPTDFLAALSLRMTDAPTGSQPYLLTKDVNFMREVFPDPTATAPPRFYALFDDESLIMAPTPDIAYTMELHYSYLPPSLTAGVDAGTTWLSINAEDTLFYGALHDAYIFMKGEQDMITTYETQYKHGLSNLKNLGEARNMKDIYRGGELRRAEA